MGIGVSIFLIAVGAVMTWGISVSDTNGFNVNTIGVILMAVGALGLLVTMVIWGSHRGGTVVEERREVL